MRVYFISCADLRGGEFNFIGTLNSYKILVKNMDLDDK